jgi:hypothetical protein
MVRSEKGEFYRLRIRLTTLAQFAKRHDNLFISRIIVPAKLRLMMYHKYIHMYVRARYFEREKVEQFSLDLSARRIRLFATPPVERFLVSSFYRRH